MAEPEESTMEDPSFRESDAKELDESPLLPEDESHGVTVVVGFKVTRIVAIGACACPVGTNPKTMARAIARTGVIINESCEP